MKKKFYSCRFISISIAFSLYAFFSIAQNTIGDTLVRQSGNVVEQLWQTYEPKWENEMAAQLGATKAEFQEFLDYNAVTINKDMGAFFFGATAGAITEDNVSNFFNDLSTKYPALYGQFVKTKAEHPEEITAAVKARYSPPPPSPQTTCNPACDNIDFSNGTLSAWSAYYGVVGSDSTTKIINSVTGGACGSVTNAGGPDANTGSDYQVQLMTAGGVDPIAGPLIPLTPPLGGLCTMIGDGPMNGHGYGLLSQTLIVSAANPILTLQYAVVLENPGHPGWQQPWFQIEVLDQNNNPIPGCGQYFVISSSNLPGFKGIPSGGDTIWCKPWVTVFVPLYNYIGQCVTVQFEAADCALGGHYGYGYVAATCSKLNLVSSSNGFCTGQTSATITGPPGAVSYQWSTANGCISGSSTLQSLTVTCVGTYKLVATSGASCVDTFTITIPAINAGPPPVPCFSTDTVCSGNPTHFNASCTTPNTGVKYYWDFYNNGVYEDSSGATPTWTYGAGGKYQVRLHIVTAAGCGADTVMTIPVDTTNTALYPKTTVTTTNAGACNQCTGTITIKLRTTSSVTITGSFCPTWTLTTNGSMFGTTSTGGCGSTTTTTSCTSTAGINCTVVTTFTNICPGTYYLYVKLTNALPPSKCTPGGFAGDTIQINIGVTGVNISSNINTAPATCGNNNGTASVTASGGTSPYTYTWSNGLGTNTSVNGLSAGTYTFTITDSTGCTASATLKILGSSNLSALVTPYFVTCYGANNGSVKITPTSGSGPYTYSWSPNVSNSDSAAGLMPGNYTITITDGGGCSGTVTTTINQPTQIKDTITGAFTNLPCLVASGNATITGSGGYAPYAYLWSNGASTATDTGLVSGTYKVTISDASGCTKVDSLLATINSLQLNFPRLYYICESGAVTITASGGSSYTWSPPTGLSCTACPDPVASPFANTTYTVTVTNGNCSDTAQVAVNQAPYVPAPTITVVGGDTLVCSHSSTYQWYHNGAPITGATDSTYLAVPCGNYAVFVTDSFGCGKSSSGINTCLAVYEVNNTTGIRVYPNPAGDQLTIDYGQLSTLNSQLSIFNVLGEKVYFQQQQNPNSNPKTVVDISSLTQGVYFILISNISSDHSEYRAKIIKE